MTDDEHDRILRRFLGDDGRLLTIPADRDHGIYWRTGGTVDL